HGNKGLPVLLTDVVDGADVGVVERGRGLRFALKTRQRLGIASNLIGKELQGYETVQPNVLALIDHAHTAAAEFLDDAVMRDGFADHSRTILRGVRQTGQ